MNFWTNYVELPSIQNWISMLVITESQGEEDICKTTFQMYDSHHEFVIMSFGLFNTPKTFEETMNQIIKLYL